MDTLIIGNQTREERRTAIVRAIKSGKPEKAARLDFASLDDAWKILSDKRRAILHVMAGAGPLAIREIARRVSRDVRAVHSDIRVLHHAGVIDKTDDGRMILPYKTIKFDFTLNTREAA
jgi:predicted transcriptional regulator